MHSPSKNQFDFANSSPYGIKIFLDSLDLPPSQKESFYSRAIPYLNSNIYSLHIVMELTDLYYLSQDAQTIYDFLFLHKPRFKHYSVFWKRLLEISVVDLKKSFDVCFNKIIHHISNERFDERFSLMGYLKKIRPEIMKTLGAGRRLFVNKHLTMESLPTECSVENLNSICLEKTLTAENTMNSIKTADFTLLDNTETLVQSAYPYTQVFKKKEITVLSKIGKGGFSSVHRILYNNEVCAMKKSFKGNFVKEVQLLEKVSSFGWAVKLIDSEYDHKSNIMTVLLEYGEIDLQRYIDQNVLDKYIIRHIWKSVIEIIHNLHKLKIIHKDIKPSNFVFVKGRLKIIDFGISEQLNPDTTSCLNSKEGTAYYSSPEVFYKGKIGRASDIWSAGCILFYMIFKKHIHQELTNSMDIARSLMKDNFHLKIGDADSSGRKVEPVAREVLLMCLEYDPRKRPTASELLGHEYIN